jgi:hypothetical protein
MVGDFSVNRPSFDPETQKLVLKQEYIGIGEVRRFSGTILIIFDTNVATEDMYPYYFYNGLDSIFDVVPINQ